MCESESGFVDLFNKEKSYDKLVKLTDDRRGAELLSRLLYGRARAGLIKLVGDAFEYEKYSKLIKDELIADGLSPSDATEALGIFLRAFGFPGYRDEFINPIGEFVSYESEKFRTVYKGEMKDGREYGVGVRHNFYDGDSCGFDECVWIEGRMLGYCYSSEVEFGAFESKKYGFVLNDCYVGKYMIVHEDGECEYMEGVALRI